MPVTPKTEKSRLGSLVAHEAPSVGYAGRIGFIPKFIRSNGVKKCRRFAFGSAFGPSGGNLTKVAARVRPQMLVNPSSRSV